MSKRAQRRHDSFKKYKQRLKTWMNFTTDQPESWKDLKDRDWSKFLKDTPHPCSCAACSGERYDRNKQKKFNNHIVEQEYDMDENAEIDWWEMEDFYDSWNEQCRKAS